MRDLKENVYKAQDHVDHIVGEAVKPLNEKLKPFNKVVGDLTGEVTNQNFEVKQQNVNEMMLAQGLDPETDYAPESINKAAIEKWEVDPPADLKEKQERLERYETALKPEKIRLSDEELKRKTDLARTAEALIIAERDRKNELRDQFMQEANLDPAKDQPTAEINTKVEETFKTDPGAEIADMRKRSAGSEDFLSRVWFGLLR
ncbi:MAG: hypothetical protein R3C11_04800 [Planctomycetaceae bacterium]